MPLWFRCGTCPPAAVPCSHQPVAHDFGVLPADSVCSVILKKAQDVEAVVIVMARHTKGRLKEMWMGSVTKACVHRSPMPVAVVPHSAHPNKA